MNIDVKQFLSENEFGHRATSNQFNVKVCPLCLNEKWKFYIHQKTGLWDCKICGESGNFYQLKGRLGQLDGIEGTEKMFKDNKPLDEKLLDRYTKALQQDKKALAYLKEKRHFSDEMIKRFQLGVDGDWIVIPHFHENKLWNLKLRNYKEKEFKRVQGQPSVIFNWDNVDQTKKALVIVESETDCIAAVQMGIENVVGLTVGASSFPPEWIKYTLSFQEIYLCLNSDPAGERGARRIAEKIGLAKCRKVSLPTKDVNDYLVEHGEKGFYDIVKKAKRFSLDNVREISTYIEELDDWLASDGSLVGLELPFPKLNTYLSGFKNEDLIVLSGDTGVGKTSFCLNFLLHFAKQQKRCLSFFLEGKIMYYILRMMSIDSKIKTDELKTSESLENLKTKFSEYPLYFYSGAQSDLNCQSLTELLPVAVRMYDIDFVLIDNLQKFIKDEKDVVQQTSRAVSILKDLAVDLKIPIVLISHIRKPERGKYRVSMHDAKSSSTIYQDADVYLTLWNNKTERDIDEDLKLSINKNRMGEGGMDIGMIFEKKIAWYRERIREIDSTQIIEEYGVDEIIEE